MVHELVTADVVIMADFVASEVQLRGTILRIVLVSIRVHSELYVVLVLARIRRVADGIMAVSSRMKVVGIMCEPVVALDYVIDSDVLVPVYVESVSDVKVIMVTFSIDHELLLYHERPKQAREILVEGGRVLHVVLFTVSICIVEPSMLILEASPVKVGTTIINIDRFMII